MKLTSVTSAYLFKNNSVTYSDTTLFSEASGAGVSRFRSFSQEFRAVSSFSGSLNFTAGLFASREHRTYDATSDIVRNLTTINGFAYSTDVINHQLSKGATYSAFVELRWTPIDRLEIAGGARGTIEHRNANLNVVFVQPAVAAATRPVNVPILAELNDGNVSPQATVSYKVTPNSSLYVGYRTGFKAGTVTNPALIPASATANSVVLRPEKIKGFEAGYKFQTADRSLSGEFAAYTYRYTDLQSASFDTVTLSVIPRNAGSATIKGAEASLRYRANDILSLHGAATYNKSQFGTFTNAQCYSGQTAAAGCVAAQQNLSGRPLARAPQWILNAGAEVTFPISDDFRLGASIDGRRSSGYFLSPTDSPFAYQSGYMTLEAAIRIKPAGEQWELALIGKNLTDKFYAVVATDRTFAVQPGGTQGFPGEPRTVVLQARYKF